MTAPLSAIASAIMFVARESAPSVGWVVVGAACSMLSFGIAAGGNVPLNRALARGPVGTKEQLRDTRKRFEAPWRRWNHARTVLNTAALVALVITSSG